jgi:hypothetical protein
MAAIKREKKGTYQMAAYNPRKAKKRPRRNVTKAQAKAMTSQLTRGRAKKKRKNSKKKGKKMTKAERSRAAKKAAKTRAAKKEARSRAAKKGAKTRARGTKRKKRKGKKARTPAQIAATKRMLAAAAKKRGMKAQAKGFATARRKLEEVQVKAVKSLERKIKRCEKAGERKESTIAALGREIRSLRARMGAARRRGDLTKKQETLLIKRLDRCRKKLGTAPKKVRRKAPTRRKTAARKAPKRKAKPRKRKKFTTGQIARKAGCVLASARPTATYGASSCKPKKAPPRTIHQAAKDLGKKRHGRLRPRLNPARIRKLTTI